jgi:tetratricopeptide (TPR) repeat protein
MSDETRDRLADTIELLEKSLADARHEFELGDLDSADFEAITERDQARLEAARRSLSEAPPPEPPAEPVVDPVEPPTAPPGDDGAPTPRPRRTLTVVLSVVVAAVLGVGLALGLHAAGSSPASQNRTYTPAQIRQIETLLTQASTLVQAGKVTEALQVYSQVLAIDPYQPEALAQSGYLTFQAGVATKSNQLATKGATQIRASVEANPNLFASRLYLGVVELVGQNDPAAALAQFQEFLKLKPPAQWVAQAQPYLAKAAAELKVPVPTTAPG